MAYHIKKDGTPGVCHAKPGNCPLGGAGEHFDTPAEAQAFIDEKNSNKYGLIKNASTGIRPDLSSEGPEVKLYEVNEEFSYSNIHVDELKRLGVTDEAIMEAAEQLEEEFDGDVSADEIIKELNGWEEDEWETANLRYYSINNSRTYRDEFNERLYGTIDHIENKETAEAFVNHELNKEYADDFYAEHGYPLLKGGPKSLLNENDECVESNIIAAEDEMYDSGYYFNKFREGMEGFAIIEVDNNSFAIINREE